MGFRGNDTISSDVQWLGLLPGQELGGRDPGSHQARRPAGSLFPPCGPFESAPGSRAPSLEGCRTSTPGGLCICHSRCSSGGRGGEGPTAMAPAPAPAAPWALPGWACPALRPALDIQHAGWGGARLGATVSPSRTERTLCAPHLPLGTRFAYSEHQGALLSPQGRGA